MTSYALPIQKSKGAPMKKTMDAPKKTLPPAEGRSIPAMPHPNPTGFKSGKMNQKPAMGPAVGKSFDNHEKCCK